MCKRFVVISWVTTPILPGAIRGAFNTMAEALSYIVLSNSRVNTSGIIYDTETGSVVSFDPQNPVVTIGGEYYLFGWDGNYTTPPPASGLITSASSLAALQGDITITKAGNTNVVVQQGSNQIILQSNSP